MPAIKFGLNCTGRYPFGAPPVEEIFATGEQAEALGYDSVWAGDHIATPRLRPECFTLLSVFAAQTRQIILGSVLLLPLRNPAIVAKTASTIDVLSRGRLILGLGVGGEVPKDFEVCGVPLAERGRRMDEGIAILRQLWREPKASHKGRFWSFHDVEMEPKPVRGDIPLWIGGRSDAALRRAARVGDGWHGYLVSPRRFRESMEKIRGFAAEIGRDLTGFTASESVFLCMARSREEAHPMAAEFLSGSYSQPLEPIVDALCVLGRPEDCAAKLVQYVEAGAQDFTLSLICKPNETLDHYQWCMEEIVTPLRKRFSGAATS
ncbi:MAG: LLM class flavin-dependent oxidoreductase [Chloroflexi bacterium]|nr:LLM class flavin-dependent oxidoreductase [Chloroflexota bacterium]